MFTSSKSIINKNEIREILDKTNLSRDELARYLIKLFIDSGKESDENKISQFSKKIWTENPKLKRYFGTWEDVKSRLMDHFQLLYE